MCLCVFFFGDMADAMPSHQEKKWRCVFSFGDMADAKPNHQTHHLICPMNAEALYTSGFGVYGDNVFDLLFDALCAML